MERRADEAERETIKLKKVQYMENHIGETFAGVISGVAEYGFFVELENTVEGLVRVTSLTDDFISIMKKLMNWWEKQRTVGLNWGSRCV